MHLGTAVADVDAYLIYVNGNAAQGCHCINNKQCSMLFGNFCDLF